MTSSKPKLKNLICLRLNEDTLTAIRKSGQNTSDWFRGAARNRLEGERNSGNPHDAADGRMDRPEQEMVQLRKEIAKLQQSEAIVQAALLDLRKTLAAVQQHQAAAQHHHVELRRSLEQMNAGFGHAFNTLGSSLMVALGQQLDRHLQTLTAKAEESPPVKIWPPHPPEPSFENRLSLFRISKALSVRKNISQQNTAPYLDCPIFVYFEPLFALETRSLQATPQKKPAERRVFAIFESQGAEPLAPPDPLSPTGTSNQLV
jgi:hypothetical protein